jgi:2,4-dienoyl-CoA reductase-like NADH-dependent reductase (Old Yellow Enzyme family)
MSSFAGESAQPASIERLIDRMERNEFDLIAVGRAILSDASWVQKIRAGGMQTLREFSAADFGQLI